MKFTRSLIPYLKEDLGQGMVFIGGPSQVGTTTLEKKFINTNKQYFN